MSHKISDNAAAMACDLLQDFTIDQIRDAAREHMKDPAFGKFMPKPAQIIERINAEKRRTHTLDRRGFYPSLGPDMNMYGDVIRKLEAEGKIYHYVPTKATDSNEQKINNVVARNKCIAHIRKILPNFTPWEDKPENKGKTQEEIFNLK